MMKYDGKDIISGWRQIRQMISEYDQITYCKDDDDDIGTCLTSMGRTFDWYKKV